MLEIGNGASRHGPSASIIAAAVVARKPRVRPP